MDRIKWSILLGASLATGAGTAYLLWWRAPAPEPQLAGSQVGRALGERATDGGHFRVALAPATARIEVGATQSWLAAVRGPKGEPSTGCSLSFHGLMPEHGHGLPTAPRATSEPEPGVYLVEGVRFSMPGFWEIKLDVDACGPRDVASFEVQL